MIPLVQGRWRFAVGSNCVLGESGFTRITDCTMGLWVASDGSRWHDKKRRHVFLWSWGKSYEVMMERLVYHRPCTAVCMALSWVMAIVTIDLRFLMNAR